MLVNLRVIGRQPQPLMDENLIQYAAALQLQYSGLCTQFGMQRRREGTAISIQIVALLGLTEVAEPLPSVLLVLLARHHSNSYVN